jgi:hypothetical protein
MPSVESPRIPPTPAFVARDTSHGEPSFQFTCDDVDIDRDQDQDRDRDQDHPFASSPVRSHFLPDSPRRSPAALLHPHHSTSLRPPTPESAFTMSTDDGLANGGQSAPEAKNPFNFQTQFISAGPVKSVCRFSPRDVLVVFGIECRSEQTANRSPPEHRPTARSPLQTQLDKRTTPNLPRTAPAATARPPRLPPDPNIQRSMG